jgi:hypothetical protein
MITYYFWLSCVSLTLNLILIHEIRKIYLENKVLKHILQKGKEELK